MCSICKKMRSSRCELCNQNPSILLALSILVMTGGITAAALTANGQDGGGAVSPPVSESAPPMEGSESLPTEPSPFSLTPELIKAAIEANGNHPVCFPNGASAWK